LGKRPSKLTLLVGLAATAAPLIFIKVSGLAGWDLFIGDHPELASVSGLPIGISFYTLQALSYIVDVYRRTGPLSGGLETHALYLAFFPQLLAGPIERGARLIPQVVELRTPSAGQMYVGAKTILWGYFCKLVIADNIGRVVDHVLGAYADVPPASLPVALYLYSFQIYFDFLGYSMIAIGLGYTFGVALSTNFDRPYLARSLREFWSRWHITLSSWLRDYVYVPLGGRRHGHVRFAMAIGVTFLISGLWHGASVNFLVWGGLHALLILFASLTASPRRLLAGMPLLRAEGRMCVALRVWFCFSLVSFTWLFFRIEDLIVARAILFRMAQWPALGMPLELAPILLHPDTLVFLVLVAFGFVLDATGTVQRVLSTVPRRGFEVGRELALVNVMAIALLLFGDLGNRAFIYFRF
jgi:D-alanyl-lipoteichoic acid acyltransferase DltB (MBOAT superfamily)